MSTFHLTSIHGGQEDLLTFNILYSFVFVPANFINVTFQVAHRELTGQFLFFWRTHFYVNLFSTSCLFFIFQNIPN